MSYVIDTLTIFNKALEVHQPKVLDRFMQKNHRFGKEIAKDFHGTQLNETLKHSGLTDIVIKILMALGIPSYQWGRYLGSSMSVYQFLLEINEITHKKHVELQKLIDHIDTKMGSIWYTLGMVFIFSLLIFTLLFPFFIQSEVITILSEIVTAVLFIPSLQIIYNAGFALYSFYSGVFDTHIPLSHRLLKNVFEISSAAIKIAASCLVFVVVATSPIVSILIITATALSVIKEAVSFIQLFIERRKKNLGEEVDPLTSKLHQARLDNTFKKTRNHLISNIVAAVLITTIVAVWTFVPGGIPLIVGAITAMALVYAIKLLYQIYNEKTKKTELLKTFDELESEERNNTARYETGYNDSAEPEECMTYSNLHTKLAEPLERMTVTEPLPPVHFDPLFQVCGGNEKEEINSENDSTFSMLSTTRL